MTIKNDLASITQKTLSQPITYVGIGLHTGCKAAMVVRPAEPDSGINFLRKDAPPGKGFIAARWYDVVETHMSTVLGNQYGVTISTVEHLMAALHGCGVDNALIEIDGPEIPIMDGSSHPFVTMIEKSGTVNQPALRKAIWLQRRISVKDNDKEAALIPSSIPSITVDIDFPDSAVGKQTYTVQLVNEAFRADISRARTFGFAKDIERLQKLGLARGGSLHNAILVDGDRIVNAEGLRYKDEFVRHKILDTLGDLALIGIPIYASYYGKKPGHTINNALLHKLFEERDAWSYITIDEYNTLVGRRNEWEQDGEEYSQQTQNAGNA
ncbi:MAG: UDP-3-O-acyl-N-acetylglucosamine deacetylase [Gammaproteobacteria bacterium]|nr:UDP-3-O-acyl-N-acetylglucosamine deacetylase [Gammaproteobacteria bacterium]